jgi:hypothetical protein
VAGPARDFAGSLQSGIGGLRIGVVRNFPDRDTGAGSAIGSSQEVFRRLGAVVSEVRLSSLTHYNNGATTIARGMVRNP